MIFCNLFHLDVYVVFVWIVSTNCLQQTDFNRYLTQEEVTLYIEQNECRLEELVKRSKEVPNTELGKKCRLEVFYENPEYDNYHTWRMLFHLQAEDTEPSIRRKMKKCNPGDKDKDFILTCDIYNNSSLGDICLSKENCLNNTVCSIDRFYGRCTCPEGFHEENRQCIKELSEHVIPNIMNMDKTFFDTKASVAIWFCMISLILGVSVTTLILTVYISKSQGAENPQNLDNKHRLSQKEGLNCSATLHKNSQNGTKMEIKANSYKNSDATIEVIHEENDRNYDNAQDPCPYNHLNEKEEIESVSENKYGTAEREIHNDAENTYARVQSRKSNSKQLIIDDVYMPITLKNDL